jgi:hypothetical protein
MLKKFCGKENQFYSAAAGVLFNREKTILVRFPPKSPEAIYTVPKGVKVIGKHAFQNARNLTEITLPDTLETIDDSAFDDCKNLRRITIPNTVTSIGPWAFHGCDKIERIVLSKSIKTIGLYAFGSCESLRSIEVDKRNLYYCSHQGDLYTKDMRELLQYAIAKRMRFLFFLQERKRLLFGPFRTRISSKSLIYKMFRLSAKKRSIMRRLLNVSFLRKQQ